MTKREVPAWSTALAPLNGPFRDWLIRNGSAVHAPTNPWECLRFDTPDGVGVIYRDKLGRLSYTGGAQHALFCFLNQKAWRGCARGKLSKADSRRLRFVKSVAERDGWTCCYCGGGLTEETATLEHFVSRTHGGPDHLANMMLAHGPCNAEAGHLDVRAKIEIVVRMRLQGPSLERAA